MNNINKRCEMFRKAGKIPKIQAYTIAVNYTLFVKKPSQKPARVIVEDLQEWI